jgi:hypothetical protein
MGEISLSEILVALLQPDRIAENELVAPRPTRDDYLRVKREYDEADAAGKQALRRKAFEEDNEFRECLIDLAKQGAEQAHFALLWDALYRAAYAEPLPPLLQEYMLIDAPTFKRRHGGQPQLLPAYEDQCIAGAVALLVQNGVNPYRYRDRAGAWTACALVAEALRKAADILRRRDLKKAEGAVAKIYERCDLEREEVADQIRDLIAGRSLRLE